MESNSTLLQSCAPLRTATLRELSRIILKRLAPDAQIKASGWHAQAPGHPPITRAQRVTYAVQAGLLDDFVSDTLQLDVDKMRRDLLKAIEELNRHTHIEPTVFGITGQPLTSPRPAATRRVVAQS